MNKRDLAFAIARYSETTDKLNWVARYKALMAGRACDTLSTRYDLYRHVHERIGNRPINYLEFGVAGGKSLRAWTELNRDEDSRFVGFDTFTGLPEAWNWRYGKGAFSQDGRAPDIEDHRVTFEVGLFQDTLRPFLATFRATGQLVVHMDADIFTSTLFVLTQLDAYMPSGTVILFDEYQSFLHEFRAWHDYLQAFRRTFSLIGQATRGIHTAVFLV